MADVGLINGGADADIRAPMDISPPASMGLINNADLLARYAASQPRPIWNETNPIGTESLRPQPEQSLTASRDFVPARTVGGGLWGPERLISQQTYDAFGRGSEELFNQASLLGGSGLAGSLGSEATAALAARRILSNPPPPPGTLRNQRPPVFPSDHPNWIPGRLVTSKRALDAEAAAGGPDPDEPLRIADIAALQSTPDLYGKNAGLLRDYPNVTQSMASRGKTDSVVDHLVDHMVDNLTALHDAVPAEVRARSQLWYDGANKIANELAAQYGLPDYSVAGVIAAMSPQKDWFQNVSLAKRVIETMVGGGENFRKGFTFNDEMNAKFNSLKSMRESEDAQGVRAFINGKSLSDIDEADITPEEKGAAKALWVRMYDETYNDPSHEIVTPEGDLGDLVRNQDKNRTPSRIGWGSLGEIQKAVEAIDNPGENGANMSNLMGERHKVRYFFNNILDPNALTGDVTIDTHAVAAALMRPLTGSSVEVSHNFGNYAGVDEKTGIKLPNAGGSSITGIQGTYPIIADAYRIAANRLGILPRQLQSITWEAVRGLFPDNWKTEANMAAVDAIWAQYRKGRISQSEARQQVSRLAGGINPPAWYNQDVDLSGGLNAPPWAITR